VVKGIADYGNCLIKNEIIFIRNSGKIQAVKIGEYVDELIKSYPRNWECLAEELAVISAPPDVYVLSYDLTRRSVQFSNAIRFYRSKARELIEIKTSLGRKLTVTPDHPLVIFSNGFKVKASKDIKKGDLIPILADFPCGEIKVAKVDIINEIVKRGLSKITVKPRLHIRTYRRKLVKLFSEIGISSSRYCRYFTGNYLPLKAFLALEKTGKCPLKREELLLYPGRGKVAYAPALIEIDAEFARLLGYYLSGGCLYEGNGAARVIWTFNPAEKEYISDLTSILRKLGLRYSVRHVGAAAQIKVSSWILGLLLKDILKCGCTSHDKQIPSLLFNSTREVQIELLKGILRGGGYIKLEARKPFVTAGFSTVSPILLQQVLLLLQALGYAPCYEERFQEKSKKPLFDLRIHGYEAIKNLKQYFSKTAIKIVDAQLKKHPDLSQAGYRFNRISNIILVPVKSFKKIECNNFVYDLEVPPTHLFITTGGIITHNCTGIPTVAGEIEFDDSFETNCLVNVACVGIAKHKDVTPSEMRHPGDWLVLVGGSTGRDGIHGVTFASRTLTEMSEADRPAVQIGDPFLKKILIEATLEAIRTGYVHGLKDLGGGGLTCASSEMAAKGGVGAELLLEKMHLREDAMTPFEMMLSESQERMLFVLDPRGLNKVLEVFAKYDLPYSIIGKVTSTGELIVKYHDKIVARIKPQILANAPVIYRKAKKPSYITKLRKIPKPPSPGNLSDILYRLLAAPNIASKEWVYRQYDHEVGIRTILKPGDGDAAVLRLLETSNKAVAVKADCNSRHCYLDPYNGHAGAVAEAARNVVAVGAEPIAMVDGCNFGNPEKTDVFWQFKESIRGMADMCKALKIPCVGGNVSFYNEDEKTGKAVKPTAIVLMVGLIDNLDWVTTLSLKEVNDVIIVIGETYSELGGSEYYHEIYNIEGGKAPKADPRREKASMSAVLQSIRAGYITAAHDCSKGGLAVALALMAIKGNLGVKVSLKNIPMRGIKSLDELLFSESYARFIVSAPKKFERNILKIARESGAPAAVIGRTTDSNEFTFYSGRKPVVQCQLGEMERIWRGSIPKLMGVIK
jgi:phosphoribosylformylglycinamidine synthase